MKALAFILFCTAPAIASPPRVAMAQQAAIDTLAARQLASAYLVRMRAPEGLTGGDVACGFAHYEGQNIVIDSVPSIVPAAADFNTCKGTGANVVFGFTALDASYTDVVLHVLDAVLARRPDLDMIGQVHGVAPAMTPSGRWMQAPLIWAAWRPAPSPTKRA